MLKHFTRIGAAVVFLLSISQAYGQKSTEIFIPVGKSPGLSGKYTAIGKIEAVNAQNQTITMADPSGNYTVKIAKQTQVWLDNSKLKKTNQKGAFADLRKGALVEVKFEKNQRKNLGTAEWVKVEVVEPGGR
jgi:hypothetical protein